MTPVTRDRLRRTSPAGILTAVESEPEICVEVWWGKRLAAVRVDLRRVDPSLLSKLLGEAWELRAPKRVLGGRPSSGSG